VSDPTKIIDAGVFAGKVSARLNLWSNTSRKVEAG